MLKCIGYMGWHVGTCFVKKISINMACMRTPFGIVIQVSIKMVSRASHVTSPLT